MRYVWLLSALVFFGSACAPSDSGRFVLDWHESGIVSSQDVVCLPGARFQTLDDSDGEPAWLMRATGQILCSVSNRSDVPLTIRLEPSGNTQLFRFELFWDDEPLGDGPVRFEGRGLDIEVPPEKLTPGAHRLRMQRKYEPVPAAIENFHDNEFSSISYRVGDHQAVLELQAAESLHYAGRLLERGVTGLQSELWSGLLFDGPQSATVSVEAPGEGLLAWPVENVSDRPATFQVEAPEESWEAVIPPRERGRLEIPLSGWRGELSLSVRVEGEGSRDSRDWFLWSQPFFRAKARSRESPGSPPIFLLTLDTTRKDALSPYGEASAVTPHIDDFAQHATIFDRAYSTTSWTLPSHASMMTGLYPSRHRAGVTYPRVPEDSVTLAELLGRAGYRTAGFPGSRVCSSLYGIGRGFHVFRDPDGYQVVGDVMTDRLVRFLDRGASDAPWFVFANYFDPHILHKAPRKYQERLNVPSLAGAVEGHPVWERLAQGEIAAWSDIIEGKAPATPEILQWLRASYLSEVAFMDAQLGRFFQELRDLDLYDDAMIVLVADHGELLGEGGQFSHSARLDPELVEVPLLIKWPGQVESRRVSDLVSVTDLFPTLLAAGGLDIPPNDGRRLTPRGVVAGDEPRPRVFLEEHESLVHPLIPGQKVADHLYGVQALRSQRVVWPGGEICLGREDERWHGVDCPPHGDELYERLRSLLGTGASSASANGGKSLSQEEQESLEALGYL